jgi:hypothetical protein
MFPIFRLHAARGAALIFVSGSSYGEVIGQLEGDPLYHANLDSTAYRQLLEEKGFAVKLSSFFHAVARFAEDLL